jgi:hypothetical protein
MLRKSPCRLACSAFVLMLSAVALGACGGASGSGEATAAGQSSSDKQESARLKLQACLRDHGVDLPGNPREGGQPPSQADLQKLQEAVAGPCKRYRNDAFGDFSEQDRAELEDRLVKFASCMRRHGVDVPDPSERPQVVRIDRDDPKVQKAAKACRALLPQGGRGGFIGPGPGR